MPQNPIPDPPKTQPSIDDDLDQLFGTKRVTTQDVLAPIKNQQPKLLPTQSNEPKPGWLTPAEHIAGAVTHLAPLFVAPEGAGAGMLLRGITAASGPVMGQTFETISGKREWDTPEKIARNIGTGAVEAAANYVHLPFVSRIASPWLKAGARVAEGAGINTIAGAGMRYSETGKLPTLKDAELDALFGGGVGGALGAVEGVAGARARARASKAGGDIPPPPGPSTPPMQGPLTPEMAASGGPAKPGPAAPTGVEAPLPKAKVPKGKKTPPAASQTVAGAIPTPPAPKAKQVTFITPVGEIDDAHLDSFIKQSRDYMTNHPEDNEVATRLAQLETEAQIRAQRNVIKTVKLQAEPLTPEEQAAQDHDQLMDRTIGAADTLPDRKLSEGEEAGIASLDQLQSTIHGPEAPTQGNGLLPNPPTPEVTPEAQTATASPAASVPQGKGGKKSPRLPKELRGGKPTYNRGNTPYEPNFKSDVDRAAYIIAKTGVKSKQDALYLKFVMEHTGLDEKGARAYGKEVRNRLATAAKEQPGGGPLSIKRGQYGQALPTVAGAVTGGIAGAAVPPGDEKNGINWKQRAINGLMGAVAGGVGTHALISGLPGEAGMSRPRWAPPEELGGINDHYKELVNRVRQDPELGAQLEAMGQKPENQWDAHDHELFDKLYQEWRDKGGPGLEDLHDPNAVPPESAFTIEHPEYEGPGSLEAHADDVVAEFIREHGREPTPAEIRGPIFDEAARRSGGIPVPEPPSTKRPSDLRDWDKFPPQNADEMLQRNADYSSLDYIEQRLKELDEAGEDTNSALYKAYQDAFNRKVRDPKQNPKEKEFLEEDGNPEGMFTSDDYRKAEGPRHKRQPWDDAQDQMEAALEQQKAVYEELKPLRDKSWELMMQRHALSFEQRNSPEAQNLEAQEDALNAQVRALQEKANDFGRQWDAARTQRDLLNERTGKMDFVDYQKAMGEKLNVGDYNKMSEQGDIIKDAEANGEFYKQPLVTGQGGNADYLRNLLEQDNMAGMAAREVFHEEGLTPDHIDLMDPEKLQGTLDQIQNRIDQFQPGGDFLSGEEGSASYRSAMSAAGAAAGGLAGYYSTDDPELKWTRAIAGAATGGLGGFALGRSLARDHEMRADWEARVNKLQTDGIITSKQAEGLKMEKGLPSAPMAKKAGALNLDNYDTTKTTKDFLNAAYQSMKREIDSARKIGLPMRVVEEQAVALAREAALDPKSILKSAPKGVEPAAWLRAKVILNLGMAETMVKEANRLMANSNDPQALADFYSSYLRYMEVHKNTQTEVSGIARALRAMQNEAKAVKVEPAAIRLMNLLEQSGGNPEVAQKIAEKLAQLSARGATVSDINRTLGWLIGAKTPQQLHLLYTSMLVSRFPTQVANTLGNVGGLIGKFAEIPLAGAVDKFSQITSNRPRSRYAAELPHAIRGLATGMTAAWDMAEQTMRTGESAFEGSEISQHILSGVPAPKPGEAMWYPTAPLRFMQAADDFGKSLVHTIALHQLAYRRARSEGLVGLKADARAMELVSNPDDVMDMLARDEAHYRTYTKELGPAGKWFAQGRSKLAGGIGKWLIPFYRTDINLMKQGLERSVAAIPYMGYKTYRGDYKIPEDVKLALDHNLAPDFQTLNNVGQLSDDSARVLMGAGITATALWLVNSGLLTGQAPSDPAERALWKAKGIKPYSIKLGNDWFPFDRLAPLGISASVAADWASMAEKYKEGGWDAAATQFKTAITNQIVGRGMMMGLLSAANAITEKSGWEAFQERLASSTVPGLVQNVNNVIDPVRRNPNSPGQAMAAHIPGMSQDIAPYRDLFGQQDVDRRTAMERMFSPIDRSPEQDDPVLNWMLANHAGTTPSKGELKNNMTLDENEVNIPLSIPERSIYEDAKGRAKYWAARRLIENPNFSTMPKLLQKKRLQTVMSQASNAVTQQLRAYKLYLRRPWTVGNLTREAPPPYAVPEEHPTIPNPPTP